MKLWIAGFFMFIFSFQVLPVKEVGKLLFKSQLTEERHNTGEDGHDVDLKLKKENEFKDLFSIHAVPFQARARYFGARITIALIDAQPPRHLFSPEVLTPPPNC